MMVTEALAEIKTIDARIEKKAEFIHDHVVRREAFRDPLAGQGGSKKIVAAHMQAIRDLMEHKLELRASIRRANESSSITIDGVTRSVADWLAWKREVASSLISYLKDTSLKVVRSRQEAFKKGGQITDGSTPGNNPNDIIVNLDELALSSELEKVEHILGTLDGQLSLFNATTVVSFPIKEAA